MLCLIPSSPASLSEKSPYAMLFLINSDAFNNTCFFSISVTKSSLICECESINSFIFLSFSKISFSNKSKYVEPNFLSRSFKSLYKSYLNSLNVL